MLSGWPSTPGREDRLFGPDRPATLISLSVKRHVTLDVFANWCCDKKMEVANIRHKGLARFFETGNPKGLVGDTAQIRKMLAFIDAAKSLEELSLPPNYSLHELTGG